MESDEGPLAVDEEARLFGEFRAGSLQARDQLIARLLPFAKRICRKTLRGSACLELDDAVQFATMAMLEALPRFEPERGLRLTTFLSSRIRGACLDYLRSLLPAGARRKSSKSFGKQTTRCLSSVDLQELRQFENVHDSAVSEVMECLESIDLVETLAARCKPPGGELLRLYFLQGLTLRQIGQSLGVCERRCSQLLSQTIADLRSRSVRWDIRNGDLGKPLRRHVVDADVRPAPVQKGPPSLKEAAHAIVRATETELADLDKTIAECEATLASLKTLRKLVALRLGHDQKKKSDGTGSGLGDRILEIVRKAGGKASLEAIASQLGKSQQTIAMSVGRNGGLLKRSGAYVVAN